MHRRTERAHEMLKRTKRYIKCLQDKLSDEELKNEFARMEREEAQVTVDLDDESDGNN